MKYINDFKFPRLFHWYLSYIRYQISAASSENLFLLFLMHFTEMLFSVD